MFAVAAALLFCGNGATSRVLLDAGLPATRLSGLRAAITFVCIFAWLLISDRQAIGVRRADAPRLAAIGVAGLALVNLGYFIAIKRLGVGVGLTLEYLGPILLLLWLRARYRRVVPIRVWLAAGLAFAGCMLVVEGWKVGSLDPTGIGAGLLAAFGFAVYVWGGERAGRSYRPATTLLWLSGAAALFWMIITQPWTFDWSVIGSPGQFAAATYVGVIGTLAGFGCAFAAVRHIPAARASVVMTLEPALAALIAWPTLGELLSPIQILGGVIVLASVMWIQLQRTAGPEEAAPPFPGSPTDGASIPTAPVG